MFVRKHQQSACALAIASAVASGGVGLHADNRTDDRKDGGDDDQRVKTVFVVAMENHNWTQPGTVTNPKPGTLR